MYGRYIYLAHLVNIMITPHLKEYSELALFCHLGLDRAAGEGRWKEITVEGFGGMRTEENRLVTASNFRRSEDLTRRETDTRRESILPSNETTAGISQGSYGNTGH